MHGLDFHAYLPSPGTPVLATLHLPAAWYPRPVFDPERPRTYLNCVSAAQARSCPRSRALIGHVDNGVALDRFRPAVRKREYLLALGRICPEKGLHLALVAARRTGLPLVLAGEVFPYEGHRRYFEREIAPRLDASRRYVGKVGLERKRRLLAGAKALLVPSLVDETSSLVAMEALASGTPVIAFRAGALADIVEDRVTGYLVDDLDGIVRAIGAIDQIDPAACRRAAEQRFSAERMVNEYLRLYRSLASPISALAAAG
jgi:glycosyltransferase involved in cell wall biosynthesis